MLEELNVIAKELDQFRKSTNTKMSYPKVIKDKVISLLDKGLPVSKVSEKNRHSLHDSWKMEVGT